MHEVREESGPSDAADAVPTDDDHAATRDVETDAQGEDSPVAATKHEPVVDGRPLVKSEASDPPSVAARHFSAGEELFAERRWDEAIAQFSAAIELDGEHPDAHYYRGRAHLELARYRDAVAAAVLI